MNRPSDPAWRGHRLSEWLTAWESNLRFADEQPSRSGFSDAEIEAALDALETQALPVCVAWLQVSRESDREGVGFQSLAVSGFQYYGTNMLPYWAAVESLTHSQDRDVKLAAYEAAFFSRPPKEQLFPLVERIFREEPAEYHELAAQWLMERFPEEAARRGLREKFPQFYRD